MKKFMFLIVLVLIISSVCYAQQDREIGANYELMGGFGTGYPKHSSPKIGSNINPVISFTYTHNFSKHFGLGAGVSWEKIVEDYLVGGPTQVRKGNVYGLYGDVRGYIPTNNSHIAFIGVFDIGASIIEPHGVRDNASAKFMCSPQIGMRIYLKEEKKTAVNIRFYYKCIAGVNYGTNSIGLLAGISF